MIVTYKTITLANLFDLDERGMQLPSIAVSGNVGRPQIIIDRQQLEYLLALGFKIPQVADMLSISVRTVKNRIKHFGLHKSKLYNYLENEELDAIIRSILNENPNYGKQPNFEQLQPN